MTPRRRRLLLAGALAVLLGAAAVVFAVLRDTGARSPAEAGATTGAVAGITPPPGATGVDPSASASGPAKEPTGVPSQSAKPLPVTATGGGRYPARFSVGAPGVKPYRQSDASLPVPAGYKVLQASNAESKEWDLYDCKNTVNIDHKYIKGFIYVGTSCHGTVNITNTIIAPPPGSQNRAVLVNADGSGQLHLNLTNVTIRPEPVGLGEKSTPLNDHAINDCVTCTITLNRVDVANTGGMCLCGARTTIRNSWLHDNYIANLTDPGQAHTGGVFPYGGTGPVTIENSRLEPGIDAHTGKEVKNYWKAITAVLFTQSVDGSVLRNYTVRNSFISLGAYGLYAQTGADIRITDNVFGPTHWDAAGGCDKNCSVTFGEWSNNVVGTIDGVPTKKQVPQPK
ncbi:hypothetical protein ACWT_2987 [Actinoplanes sp. SE50]|uniref:hypothetical protein n=1 Tax=unclassified Actinoplanes TaxID=2626549 RepID=UPI00023EBD2C|nr:MULTISPECIES: hypothetical protein [unclassified Actinoplanes]AEV84009.1 hypothetical protein ACPL_3114 [Actinoplanes sp. SE50/110]ATO82402.1 hypothetical protein ACWT_2987 [Actinoplanes sp. SE50]SLL99809.1 hypothetical protein ACSP50_3041 [Actinoplanes sp. SE50/110]